MKPNLKRNLQWLLLILSTGFMVHFFSTNREEVRLLLNIRPGEAVTLILLHLVYFVLHGYRYRIVLVKCSGRALGFYPWFRLFILGRFLNTMVPQLGNLYRAVRLKEDHQVTYTRYVSSFFSFAWMDTCFNLLAGAIVIGLVNPGLRVGSLPATHLLLWLAGLFGGIPIVLEVFFRNLTIRARFLSWLHAKLAEVLRVSVGNLRHGGYMAKVFLMGLVVFAEMGVVLYVGFHSLGIRVGVGEVIFFYVLLKLATYVNLTPGNIGALEIGFGVLGEQMGIGMGEGMLVSAVLRVVRYIALFGLALPMGGLDVFRQRKSYRGHQGGG